VREPKLVVGHGSSRPLTDQEYEILERHKAVQMRRDAEEAARKERLKGYLFWCSEGCGFVDEFHRCEQWTQITYISPELIRAIKERKS
jgi:hypothetical protein